MAWLTLAMPRKAAEVPRKVQPIISGADEFSSAPLQVLLISACGINEELVSWSLILFTLKSLHLPKYILTVFYSNSSAQIVSKVQTLHALFACANIYNPGIQHFATSQRANIFPLLGWMKTAISFCLNFAKKAANRWQNSFMDFYKMTRNSFIGQICAWQTENSTPKI